MTEPGGDRAEGTTDEALRAGATGEALRAGATGEALRGEAATDEALRALAEPRRRAILRLVAHDELAAGEIAAAFDVTRTAVSQHLTVLKNAGLLAERRDGTRRLYRARPEGLDGLRQFLDDLWASSLDAARRLVEAERGIREGDDAAAAG
jgi:DNA-binding transcriptional ArsR family regulator